MMNVGELKKLLEKFDDETEVLLEGYYCDSYNRIVECLGSLYTHEYFETGDELILKTNKEDY